MILINLPGTKNCFLVNDVSNSQTIEHELKKAFFPYAQQIHSKSVPLQYGFWLETNGHFITVKNDDGILKVLSESICAPYEVYKSIINIIRDNIQLIDDYCYLHGAAVVINGHPCLFLSETGAGKSTLGVYSDSRGQPCITDDLIILHKRTKKIFPVSQYAHLREEGAYLLQNPHTAIKYNRFLDRYEYKLSTQRFQKEYRVEHIFILHRKEGQAQVSVSVSAFDRVLENMFLPYQVKNNAMSAYQICNDFTIYELYYQELFEVLGKMIEFVCSC